VNKSAQATLVGEVFDDAATGQGLLNYFLCAINCGAVTEAEALPLTGLTATELRLGSLRQNRPRTAAEKEQRRPLLKERYSKNAQPSLAARREAEAARTSARSTGHCAR
jgi:hypothetical protein